MLIPVQLITFYKNGDLDAIEEYIRFNTAVLQNPSLLGRAVRHGSLEVVKKVYALGAQNVQEAIGYIIYGEKREIAEFLVEKGADPLHKGKHGSVPVGACEVLNSYALQLSLELSNRPLPFEIGKECLAMLMSTYSRNAKEKQACFNILEDNGIPIEDTLMMKMHQGELEAIKSTILAEPALLNKHWSITEIYPLSLGIKTGDGLHLTPLEGATLLHIAVEFQNEALVAMLLGLGANPNLATPINKAGFGGHTPLYHTVVAYPPHEAKLTKLLLEYGAKTAVVASIQQQLRHMGDPRLEAPMYFKELTPLAYANAFPIERWRNYRALDLIK